MDAIIMPQNKFESIVSNIFERSLPTLTYFTWRVQMLQTREQGFTVQEKFFNHFFKQKNIYFHAYSQQLHPWSYIDRQRADQFFRRVNTLIPGVECPAWAHQNRRVPEVDFQSLFNVAGSYNQVSQESTPSPHYNTPNYFTLQHFFNNRYNFGVYGSRVFFNEQPRGDFNTTGYYSKSDLDMINSWYANDQNSYGFKLLGKSNEELAALKSNIERWKKNFEIYFPETKKMKVEPTSHKFSQEPYFVRNVEELRDKIFTQKYLDALRNNTFNEAEWTQIKEVLLAGVDSHFFERSSQDDQLHATELFKKFTTAFDLPDLFSCTSKSGKLPENQFLDKTELRWNINFHTVFTARDTLEKLELQFRHNNKFYLELQSSGLSSSDKLRVFNQVRLLLSEEVYNPLFVSRLSANTAGNVVSQNINSLDDINRLIEILNQTKDELRFLNRKSFTEFLVRCRTVLQTVPYVPTN